MISPILSPETIILTAAMLGTKFTLVRIVLPLTATLLMGIALNTLQDLGINRSKCPRMKQAPPT
jgi:uncharacterized membrane protein YraQ (UPF0718 family)